MSEITVPLDPYFRELPPIVPRDVIEANRRNPDEPTPRGELTRAISSVLALTTGRPFTTAELSPYVFPSETAKINELDELLFVQERAAAFQALRQRLSATLGGLTVAEQLKLSRQVHQRGIIVSKSRVNTYVHRAIFPRIATPLGKHQYGDRIIDWMEPFEVRT